MMVNQRLWWDGPWPWMAYLVVYAIPWLWLPPDALQLLLTGLAFSVFFSIYLFSFRLNGDRLLICVAIMTAIGVAIIPVGGGWSVLAVYPAIQAAKLRPRRIAVWAMAANICCFLCAGFLSKQPLFWWLPSLLIPILIGGGMLSREAFYDRTRALLATQEEVRRLAGMAERERLTRDLHDVIGRTLTLVALKADLVTRLATRDADAAKVEAQTIGDQARAGLAEIRAALTGQSGGSLAQEIKAAVAALETADIRAEVQGHTTSVPPDAGAVLAMTLREAVTNVIRHAGATHCCIEIDADSEAGRLFVTDDGDAGPFKEGQGLTGMRQRLVAAGGALTVLTRQPGTRLIASVPV